MAKPSEPLLTELAAQAGFKYEPKKARKLGVCVKCGEKPDFTHGGKAPEGTHDYNANKGEYGISLLCPKCWDYLYPDGVEE